MTTTSDIEKMISKTSRVIIDNSHAYSARQRGTISRRSALRADLAALVTDLAAGEHPTITRRLLPA